ncbi:GntR family transcriptional regulator [Pseudonocardia sp. HH130630-07]|uniref:GntR family transcriptional regulator n=1 Tax=Pseudonocardia sp. HH130630-07 TaxID=1690815 RepID=UPI0018D394A0|nr:GntR family transcriptional regulator [Pseudonocardia sp. HH130630-07]
MTVQSVVDAIAEDLRRSVLTGELGPGAALTEAEVAGRYEVARATAKAAIERLVAESLLERTTHKTARVVRLGPDDVRDIYLSRAFLEAEVLRRLARSGTPVPEAARAANAEIRRRWDGSSFDIVDPDMRFHTALVDAAGTVRTSRMYRSLASEVTLCMAQVQGRQLLSPELVVAEHERIVELVEAGDGDGAAQLLDEHLARARELLAGALGGVAGPEATRPSSVPVGG